MSAPLPKREAARFGPDAVPTAEELAQAYDALGYGSAVAGLRTVGAEVVPVFNEAFGTMDDFFAIVDNGFRLDLADYLAGFRDSPVSSLDDVIAFNDQDPERLAPYGRVDSDRRGHDAHTRQEYEDFAADFRGEARAHIDGLLEDNDVEALVSLANTSSLAYAAAQYPAITVPAQPAIGLTFTGPYLSDGELISYAYAFEQATDVRTAPPVGD